MARRAAGRVKPLVLSAALAATAIQAAALIRCHCLAHGRRKGAEFEEILPEEDAVVLEARRQGVDPEDAARAQQRRATARVASHQRYSGPMMAARKDWLAQPCAERTMEPTSSGGKAFPYLLGHWPALTRFLTTRRDARCGRLGSGTLLPEIPPAHP